MDACPCAPCIKHHCIKDAAVVCRAAETGKDAPDAAGQVQERCLHLGSTQSCNSKQDQEQQWHSGLHLHSGGSAKTNTCSCVTAAFIQLTCFELLKKVLLNCR